MKVEPERLKSVLGITDVTFIPGRSRATASASEKQANARGMNRGPIYTRSRARMAA